LRIPDLPCGMPISLEYGDHPGSLNGLGRMHIDPHLRVLHFPVKLARTAKILGTLVRADRSAAAGVRIEWQAYPLGWGDPTRSVSCEDGRFEFAQVKPQAGELQLDVPGCEPRKLEPSMGETIDLGTIEVPDVVALGGRLVSRWIEAGQQGKALSDIEVRAFRGGRMLAEFARKDGALRRDGAEFLGSVTAGPLELLVTRGGTWYPGIPFQGEILARLDLPSARTGLEIVVDANAGALEVSLGEERPAEGEALDASLYPHTGDEEPRRGLTLHALPDSEGLVRFAPIPPGRYRCVLGFRPRDAGSVDEIVITPGRLTRLEKPGFATTSIFGSVRDGKGKPAQGVTITTRKFDTQGLVTTDGEGRFRLEGLTPGIHQLFVRHGDLGALEREVVALTREGTNVDIVLAGFASVIGHVKEAGVPLAGLSISAQPFRSNDIYNSITDDQGGFRFERLPGCRLRFWAAHRFVQVRDLEPGEVFEVDIELDKPALVTFLRDGAPLEDVISAHAVAFDAAHAASRHWQEGDPVHGAVSIAVPAGRVLFDLNRAGTGWNRSYLALVDRPGAEIELARHSITIDSGGVWNGPLPTATLVSIEGREVINVWGAEIVLPVEHGADGRLLVACLPDGARVRIFGYDSRGARFETTVDVPQTRLVRWP
ncbi:MAG: carboxypeptidase-like regulatory domain-containing protein, partial [Planctomycetota bacterium]